MTQEQEDCLEGIKYDLKSLWMIGFESGLRRLERLLQTTTKQLALDIDDGHVNHQVVGDYRGDTDLVVPEMSEEAKEKFQKLK